MTAQRLSPLQVLVGKKLSPLDPIRLTELCTAAERVVIDVGTGDARTAYRLAKANPAWLVIGIDPAWQRMTETAVKAARKEAKGGAPNLLLVNSSIETVPAALHDRGDEVMALMPWGKLLRGIVLSEADVCGGLRSVAKLGAPLDVAIGTSIWRDPIPLDLRDLPELTPTSAAEPGGLADRLAALGWQVTEARAVPHTELDRISSSWARRLGSAAPETVLHIRAVAVAVPDDAEDDARSGVSSDGQIADPVHPGPPARTGQAADEPADAAGP
jgi:16S rRNA (adenine(1408)-N(1))-methyltransferase